MHEFEDGRRAATRRGALGGLAAGAALVACGRAVAAEGDAPKGPWTTSGTVARAGGGLRYVGLGHKASDRPPVVLLHKLGGWSADWRFVAPLLAADRQVIAFDLPGHGDSQWLGPPPYLQSLGETAALLVGAFIELGLGPVDLVGTSLGGCVSAPLAAFWPERVRKLALISTALGGPRTLAEIAERIDKVQVGMFDAAGHPAPIKIEDSVRIFGLVHPEQIAVEGNASRRRAGRWIQPSERGVAAADVIGALPRIAAPTLLVYGDRDPAYVRFRAAAEAALKDGRTEVIPQSGAFTLQDNPVATAEVLRRFLG